jgi:membrane fusion protein (multidrug efflux system)
MSDVPQASQPAPPATASMPPRRRRFIGFLVVGVLIVAVIIGRERYQRYVHSHVSTDDAYVEGTIYSVASRVPGTVTRVNAAVNQRVRAGDVLVELDPDMSRERLLEAESGLQAESLRSGELAALRAGAASRIAAAEANLARVIASREELAAAVAVREADVRSRSVLLGQARSDLARAENLFAKKVIPRDRFEQAMTAAESARESLASAQELKKQADIALVNHATSVAQARAAVAVEKTALGQAEAALRTHGEQVKGRESQVAIARLTLGYATLVAPADGFVTRKAVEPGNQIQAGQPLMAVVSLRDLSVIANYKETQLHSIKPGLPVRIRADALPERVFTGRVESVMAGTGAAFSLFPPENASGNYVKVVQRIPVKIVLDPNQGAEEVLRVGMSVNPTILAAE